MFLRINPVYRKVWAVGLEQYLDTTNRIGYRAETLEGRVLAFGKTRAEAIADGMQVLISEVKLIPTVGNEIHHKRDSGGFGFAVLA